MKRYFGWLVLVLIAGPVFDQPVAHGQDVTSIEVTEYGLYTADQDKGQRNSAGVLRSEVSNIRHAATTTTVPAELGVHFGFRYKIVGSPTGKPIELRKVTIYPPAGLKSPKAPTPLQNSSYTLSRKIGETSFTDYAFDDPWELVPGPWTIQLWLGDRKLAEKKFTVVVK
jgi:hypothetical protein